MTFSIVIPTYNGAEFIEQCIESALNQTRPADEIIVSDDNSSDDTLKLCEKYTDRIKLYKKTDGPSGFVNGWNTAISHANSTYISILHQDDILAPTFLEEVENALRHYSHVKHLFVPCIYIDCHNNILSSPLYCDGKIKLYTGNNYIKAYYTFGMPNIHRCPGVVTHRDIFKVCQYRPEAGHIADDDFFFRVGQFTDVLGIMKPLAKYRLHKSSETGSLNNCYLEKRLLRDYVFQIKHFDENHLFDKADKSYFSYWKYKHLFRVFKYGVKHWDINALSYAIKYL